MKKWQYRQEIIDFNDEIPKKLEEWDDEGWELASLAFVSQFEDPALKVVVYLRRPRE